jgi:hypothetical protein
MRFCPAFWINAGRWSRASTANTILLARPTSDPASFKAQVAVGKSDSEMLAWVRANSRTQPNPFAIDAWSAFQDQRAPDNVEGREFYQEEHQRLAPQRDDLTTWFDYLDLDDYVSFGGRP